VPKIGVFTHVRPMGPAVIADLDTLLIALYVELTDRIIPALRPPRRASPGRPPVVTDAELVCLAVAQVLLRYNDEHHWLRAAPSRVGHLFPRLLSQPEYNRRLRGAADLLEATLRWLADHTPATTELLRLVDGTPVPCGASRTTERRSDLFGYAGDGRDTSHHRFYWGANLLLVVTCEGTTTGFGLANPKLAGERQALLRLLDLPANNPVPGTVSVGDKGLAGHQVETAWPASSCSCCAPPVPTSPTQVTSRPGCASGWRRSSGPSSISSAWTVTAAASPPGCGPASSSACSPSTR
jgi:hypothetical protein